MLFVELKRCARRTNIEGANGSALAGCTFTNLRLTGIGVDAYRAWWVQIPQPDADSLRKTASGRVPN
jgi:hypothetical protein